MQAISRISFSFALVLGLSTLCLPMSQADEPCYVVNVDGLLTNGADCAGDIVIDASVTAIGDSAFQNNTSLTSISIPRSVLSIGNYAFAGSGLTSLTVPGTVTSIGIAAFKQIGSLTSVVIQEGITSLPTQAFYNNFSNSIVNVSLPNSLTTIGDSAFFGAGLTSITIPNSVTSIGAGAFQDSLLSSIRIGERVIEIGDSAFYNNALTTLTIPNSVTSIGAYAFAVNRALTSITIGSSVTSIGTSAFQEVRALTALAFLGEEPPSIGLYAFDLIPADVVVSVPSTTEGYVTVDGLWNGFRVSRIIAPVITLSTNSEEVTVNTGISGYTIGVTGDTVTSYSISPATPSGLSFSSTTGLLSGIPTAELSATTFTITARNIGGLSTATFTLTVKAISRASDNSDDKAAAAAAAERAAAAQQAARTDILNILKIEKDLTLESFANAGIPGITSANFQEFQTELRSLPKSSLSDISEILKIAYKFEIVDKIGSDRVDYLAPGVFIEINLIPVGSKNKIALVNAVRRLPPASRDSYAEIKVAIDREILRIQARKDRLTAVIARNAQRSF